MVRTLQDIVADLLATRARLDELLKELSTLSLEQDADENPEDYWQRPYYPGLGWIPTTNPFPTADITEAFDHVGLPTGNTDSDTATSTSTSSSDS